MIVNSNQRFWDSETYFTTISEQTKISYKYLIRVFDLIEEYKCLHALEGKIHFTRLALQPKTKQETVQNMKYQ